jgi:hypothetical protein
LKDRNRSLGHNFISPETVSLSGSSGCGWAS